MVDVKWLEDCIQAGEFLYGEYPVSVLKKMYESKCPPITIEEIEDGFSQVDCMMNYIQDGVKGEKSFLTPVFVSDPQMKAMLKTAADNGNPYAGLHFEEGELEYLLAEQEHVDEYWIPTASQIAELMEKNCIHTRAMRDLEEQIRKEGGDPEYLAGIWQLISTGKLDQFESINAVMSGMHPKAYEATKTQGEGENAPEEMEANFSSLDDLNAMLRYINEFINGVNRRDRKGWPPADLFRKMHPNGLTQMPTLMPGSVHAAKIMKGAEARLRAMGANVDYSSIDNFATVGQYGERRIVKVGRNDPCPCGSGKKYKYCHGR